MRREEEKEKQKVEKKLAADHDGWASDDERMDSWKAERCQRTHHKKVPMTQELVQQLLIDVCDLLSSNIFVSPHENLKPLVAKLQCHTDSIITSIGIEHKRLSKIGLT